jgi:hypothetical protein
MLSLFTRSSSSSFLEGTPTSVSGVGNVRRKNDCRFGTENWFGEATQASPFGGPFGNNIGGRPIGTWAMDIGSLLQ